MSTVSTSHGTVRFFDDGDEENKGLEAARQASKDALGDDTTNLLLRQRVRRLRQRSPQIVPVIAAIAGAAASFANLGVSLAKAAESNSSPVFQISFINFSGLPLVLYDYAARSAMLIRAPGPILPGSTDAVIAAPGPTATTFAANTQLRLDFMVGSPATVTGALPDPIACTATITYSENKGRWSMELAIDGSNPVELGKGRHIVGATFTPNSSETGLGAFSIYSMPVEGSESEIDIALYDLAAT